MSEGALPNLVLAGFMGTGKTTVGRLLSRRLQWDLVDTDSLVESEAGISIKEIFATRGEAAFREMESAACARAAREPYRVISTGGGALIDPANRETLEASGIIVLLTCEADALLQRLEESARKGERPLLGDAPAERIASLLRVREAAYNSIHLRVDTTGLTPEEAAERVMELYSAEAQDRMSPCIL